MIDFLEWCFNEGRRCGWIIGRRLSIVLFGEDPGEFPY